MRKQEERHIIDILFVIGLFCIFALSTIFLISIGADIYGKTVSNTEINFNDRTSFAYVTEKIRQADRSGAITASTLEGRSALKLQKTVQDTAYITWLYEDEGYLKEILKHGADKASERAQKTLDDVYRKVGFVLLH